VVVEVEEVEEVVVTHSVLAHVLAQPFTFNWLHALSLKQTCLGQLAGQPVMPV
jgi:hypothetical protein